MKNGSFIDRYPIPYSWSFAIFSSNWSTLADAILIVRSMFHFTNGNLWSMNCAVANSIGSWAAVKCLSFTFYLRSLCSMTIVSVKHLLARLVAHMYDAYSWRHLHQTWMLTYRLWWESTEGEIIRRLFFQWIRNSVAIQSVWGLKLKF